MDHKTGLNLQVANRIWQNQMKEIVSISPLKLELNINIEM